MAVFFALFFAVENGAVQDGSPGGGVSGALGVIALPWSWPYRMYHHNPVSFGSLALISVALSVVLVVRRDTRGWITALLFSFGFGWLVATIVGQAHGY